jgi:hypothetical protein
MSNSKNSDSGFVSGSYVTMNNAVTLCLRTAATTGPVVHLSHYISKGPRWNDTGRGKQKNSGKENLSQSQFVHHKFHLNLPEREPGSQRKEAED